MSGKRILTMSLLLPFLTMSGAALADHNYQHHPDKAGRHSSYEAFAMAKRQNGAVSARTQQREAAPAFRGSYATARSEQWEWADRQSFHYRK